MQHTLTHSNAKVAIAAAISSLILAKSFYYQTSQQLSPHQLDLTNKAIINLPSLPSAQKTQVVRVPNFLTHQQCDELLSLTSDSKILQEAGILQRDRHGVTHNNHFIEAPWRTTYLNSAPSFTLNSSTSLFIQKLKDEAMLALKQNPDWAKLIKARTIEESVPRVIEIHESRAGGGLVHTKHYDGGSLVTFDILLKDDFLGGAFATLEENNAMKIHDFNKGDLVIFISHKYHTVQKISKGQRATFILELWEGEERKCPHRCTLMHGSCDFSKSDILMEKMIAPGMPGDE
tara:strand:+ start:463 stop:1329 length:867 start_codon:yes stop_codon:yes gene_type:complete